MFSTSSKIRIARALSKSVLAIRGILNLPTEVIVNRKELIWSLNLKEGIDLSIYALGGFELRTLRRYTKLIKVGDIVMDIGANVGAHTLPLAQLVGSAGKVYSFEPTAFAFLKQQRNISLNPSLISRISAHQMMLMATDEEPLPYSVYSSWPLETAKDLHSKHHGRLMETSGSVTSTLDSFVLNAKIDHVDFIKLDVDGNENDVLAGAKSVLKNSKPKIMLELAPYVYGLAQHKFDELLEELWCEGYHLTNMSNGQQLPRNTTLIRGLIPKDGGMNVLASSSVYF
jgi:FkbM family methyltransferase